MEEKNPIMTILKDLSKDHLLTRVIETLIKFRRVQPPNSELNRSWTINIKEFFKKVILANNQGILLSITQQTINSTC